MTDTQKKNTMGNARLENHLKKCHFDEFRFHLLFFFLLFHSHGIHVLVFCCCYLCLWKWNSLTVQLQEKKVYFYIYSFRAFARLNSNDERQQQPVSPSKSNTVNGGMIFKMPYLDFYFNSFCFILSVMSFQSISMLKMKMLTKNNSSFRSIKTENETVELPIAFHKFKVEFLQYREILMMR